MKKNFRIHRGWNYFKRNYREGTTEDPLDLTVFPLFWRDILHVDVFFYSLFETPLMAIIDKLSKFAVAYKISGIWRDDTSSIPTRLLQYLNT